MLYLFTLGRHPDLSASEILANLKRAAVPFSLAYVNKAFLILETSETLPAAFLTQLGGCDRLSIVLAHRDTPWDAESIIGYLSPTPGKRNLGLSLCAYPEHVDIKHLGLTLKKRLKEDGQSLRFILPHTGTSLNAAQVIFNTLTTAPHVELLLAFHDGHNFLAQTVAIQDIRAYEQRDTARPERDLLVGMVPPKLAQIMINLALPANKKPLTLVDPFCGTGTILQEGWLTGHRMIGFDKDQTMVEATKKNLASLAHYFSIDPSLTPHVSQHSAQDVFPDELRNGVDAIVTEPYLGKALRAPLSPNESTKVLNELGELYLRFFYNALAMLKPEGRIMFLLPAFRQRRTPDAPFSFFPKGFLDAIAKIGYLSVQLIPPELVSYFPPNERNSLFYARPDALVGRELTLWQKR